MEAYAIGSEKKKDNSNKSKFYLFDYLKFYLFESSLSCSEAYRDLSQPPKSER